LFEGRNDDVLGAGFTQGFFSDRASATYTDDYESAFEVYYNAQIAKWLNVSPSVQYIRNPSGNDTADDAVVVGVRLQMVF
jgi:porin